MTGIFSLSIWTRDSENFLFRFVLRFNYLYIHEPVQNLVYKLRRVRSHLSHILLTCSDPPLPLGRRAFAKATLGRHFAIRWSHALRLSSKISHVRDDRPRPCERRPAGVSGSVRTWPEQIFLVSCYQMCRRSVATHEAAFRPGHSLPSHDRLLSPSE